MHICNMTTVATAIGSKRIFPSSSILYPLGNPALSPDQEREKMTHTALQKLMS